MIQVFKFDYFYFYFYSTLWFLEEKNALNPYSVSFDKRAKQIEAEEKAEAEARK